MSGDDAMLNEYHIDNVEVVNPTVTTNLLNGECLTTACGNDCVSAFAIDSSKCIPALASPPNLPLIWSSLFTKMPSNAGVHTPRVFENVVLEGAMVPPSEVIQAGIDYWKDYLVGLFLDSKPDYHLVKVRYNQVWKPGGGLSVHIDNAMYYFKLSHSDEMQHILVSDLIRIAEKPFIIALWNPSVDMEIEQV